MTQPQPLPQDPEQQPDSDTAQEAAAVAGIAALLAAASAAGATYMSGQVAQAGVVNALRGLGLSRKQAGKLVELDAARPAPPVIPLQPSTRAVFKDGPTYRAHYLVNAAKRILVSAKPGGTPLGDAVDLERRYFRQHQTAQTQREQAAQRIDAAANSYGQLLGWHAVLDDRTTPECRAADGKNFYANHPPAIGLPGLKHAGNCRCYPGPPHEGAQLVDAATAPRDVAASSQRNAVELSTKTGYYSAHHHQLGTPGGPGLWGHKGWQLPNYITQIAKGIMESGQVNKSKAIAIAVGKVRDWAEGKGNVSPEVRAASVKAIAEWDALRARTAVKIAVIPNVALELSRRRWEPGKHPRLPSGKHGGGRFTNRPGSPISGEIKPPSNEWLEHSRDGLTPGEREALRVYSTTEHRDINGALRGWQPMTSRLRGIIEQLDTALGRHPLPAPVKLRRSVTPGEFRRDVLDQLPEQVGKFFKEDAYYSTSTDWDWPRRPIRLDVIVPAGVGVYGSYIAPDSEFPQQHEVLVERGVGYQLSSINRLQSGKWHGVVTLLPAMPTQLDP